MLPSIPAIPSQFIPRDFVANENDVLKPQKALACDVIVIAQLASMFTGFKNTYIFVINFCFYSEKG